MLEEDVARAGKATLRDLILKRPLILATGIATHNDMLLIRTGPLSPSRLLTSSKNQFLGEVWVNERG